MSLKCVEMQLFASSTARSLARGLTRLPQELTQDFWYPLPTQLLRFGNLLTGHALDDEFFPFIALSSPFCAGNV